MYRKQVIALEIALVLYGFHAVTLILEQGFKNISLGERSSLEQMAISRMEDSTCRKTEESQLFTYKIINLKWFRGLNIRSETLKQ